MEVDKYDLACQAMEHDDVEKALDLFLEALYEGQVELSWGMDIIQKAAELGLEEGKRQLAWYYVENNIELEKAAQWFYEMDDHDGFKAVKKHIRNQMLNKENI